MVIKKGGQPKIDEMLNYVSPDWSDYEVSQEIQYNVGNKVVISPNVELVSGKRARKPNRLFSEPVKELIPVEFTLLEKAAKLRQIVVSNEFQAAHKK
jgi:hypothetical protein